MIVNQFDSLTTYIVVNLQTADKTVVISGVATLGHAGARALPTRGRAPPSAALILSAIVALLIANRALNGP